MSKMIPQKENKIKYYIVMHIALFFLSFSGVCSKFAAQSEWFTPRWVLLYGAMLFILFIYAFVWQQLLKHLPLTVAFSNKAVILFWGMLWGGLLFGEQITLKMIIAAAVVFAGIIIISTEKEATDE